MNEPEQICRGRRLPGMAILLLLLVAGGVGLYAIPFPAPTLPSLIPPDLVPRFEQAHRYIWPQILSGWLGPAISMLAIALVLGSGIGQQIEHRYGKDRWKRWPMRILFLVGLYTYISLVEAPGSIRGFFHAREFGLTPLTFPESLGLRFRGMPIALGIFVLKYLLVFCCMAIFRSRWWVGATVMVLLVFHLVPEYVSRTVPMDPITNYAPLPEGPYRQAMDQVSTLADEDMTYLVEDRSQRSETVNMYMTGRVGREYVVVTDTLLDCLSPAEVAAVLAHEYGHKVTRVVTVALDLLISLATLLAIFFSVHVLHGRAIIAEPLRLRALVQILLAAQVVALVSHPFALAVYRNQERTADDYALALTQDPEAFRGALLKVSAANLEPWSVPRWVYVSSASHPLLKDRVEKTRAVAGADPVARGRILFDSNRSGTFGIYTMADDGTDIQPVVDSGHQELYPSLSPDGQWVAYARTAGTQHFEDSEIRMCRLDGTEDHQVDPHGSFPRFHKETGRLYFMRDRYEIMILDPTKDLPPERLFPDEAGVGKRQVLLPSLSPDGRRLAFTTDQPGQWYTAVVDLTSGEESLVGRGCEPFWALNGEAVIWVSSRNTRERTGILAWMLEDQRILTVQDDDAPWGHEYFPWASQDSGLLLWSACPPGQHAHAFANYQIFLRRGLDAPPVRLTRDKFNNRWPKWYPIAD